VKIDNSIKSVSGARTREAQGKKSRNTDKVDSAALPPHADSVEINPLSSQLQVAESVLQESPIVDISKVEAVREEIREGNFRVDSQIVADRLLASAKEFLARRGNLK
jgi:negative regulator of flagellin synthesis FlgM